jgi:hypothetical protein
MSQFPPTNYFSSPLWDNSIYLVGGTQPSDCSFHGHPDTTNNIHCICDDGWTGKSDFVNSDGVQCQIHEWGIKTIWIILIIIVFTVYVRGLPHILDITHRFLDQRARRAQTKKPSLLFDILQNKTMMAIAFFYGMAFPSMLFMGFWRIFDSDNGRLGISVPYSIAWFFIRMGIYGGTACHQPNMMKFLLKATNRADDVIKTATIMSTGLLIILTIAGITIIPVLITQGNDVYTSRICFTILCFVVGLIQLLIAVHAKYVMDTLDGVLTQSYSITHQPKVLDVQSRMRIAQKSVIKASAVQIFIYWGILVCPPLWICFDYILPISFMFPTVMGWRVLQTLSNIIKQRSTGRGGTSKNQTAITQVSAGAPLAERGNVLNTLGTQNSMGGGGYVQSKTDGSETQMLGLDQSVMLVDGADDPALLLLGGDFEKHRESTVSPADTPESQHLKKNAAYTTSSMTTTTSVAMTAHVSSTGTSGGGGGGGVSGGSTTTTTNLQQQSPVLMVNNKRPSWAM